MTLTSHLGAQVRPALILALVCTLISALPARAARSPLSGNMAEPVRCYVDVDATGANNGSSWTDAYRDLQSILGVPPILIQCGEVWVAEGTYKP
ncbi:MAG: hypothetical protein ACM3QS_00985, partial [Bacteroidota bacterium]